MEVLTYRKYLVKTDHPSTSFASDWKGLPTLITETSWVPIEKRVRKYSGEEKRHCNHPDVRNHLGFWGNSTTLIMGYRLKNNDEIIRPIWSYERERQHILFLNQYHKKFQKKKRKIMHSILSKCLILKQLPPKVVRIIIHITY